MLRDLSEAQRWDSKQSNWTRAQYSGTWEAEPHLSGSTFVGDGIPDNSSMSVNDQESKIDLGLQITFIEWANSQTDNEDWLCFHRTQGKPVPICSYPHSVEPPARQLVPAAGPHPRSLRSLSTRHTMAGVH